MVDAHKIQIRLVGQPNAKPADIFLHLPGSLLVVFHFRYEYGSPLLHGGKGRVQPSAAARHIFGAKRQRFSFTNFANRSDHAVRHFADSRACLVAVPESDGQRCCRPECHDVTFDEFLYHILVILNTFITNIAKVESNIKNGLAHFLHCRDASQIYGLFFPRRNIVLRKIEVTCALAWHIMRLILPPKN